MFGSIGMPELILIFVVALLVFGPKKLPELGKSLGKGLAEFKKASEDLKRTIEDEIEQGKHEAEAVKKEAEAVEKRSSGSRACRPRPSPRRLAPRRARSPVRHPDSSRLSGFNPRDLLDGAVGRPPAGRGRRAPADGVLRAPGRAAQAAHRLDRRGLRRASLLCWYWAPPLFDFLARPIRQVLPPGQNLAYTTLTEPFMMYFRVALLAGILISSPVVLWQIWLFISPALYRREKRWVWPFVTFGAAFFLSGCAFAYYVAFPARRAASSSRWASPFRPSSRSTSTSRWRRSSSSPSGCASRCRS